MGKKMKLPQLNDKECEKILSVINRDFDLRQREKERLRKIEQDLSEAAAQRSVLAKRKEFNEKGCIHCCSTFNLLFNKRLQCRKCKFFVCRNCANWDSRFKSWLCSVCEIERNLYVQSCEWFYEHLKQKYKHFGSAKVLNSLGRKRAHCHAAAVDSENDSGYGHSADSAKIPFSSLLYKSLRNCENGDTESLAGSSYSYPEDEESLEIAEVKQHIENVVEGLIGQSLDNARVDRPYTHPQYLQLFHDYHDELVEALKNFYEALHYALQNKPPVDDATPTTTHAILKRIIVDISEQSSSLPFLEELSTMPEKDCNGSVCSDSELMNSNVFNSYEDLLASAIINKMVEMTQKKYMTELNRNNNGIEEVCDNSDLDVPLTPSLGVGIGTQSEASDSDKEQTDDSASSIGGIDVADHEFTWANGIGEQRPKVEYIIVEHIEEEVTREEYTDGEGEVEKGNLVKSSHQRSRVVEEPPIERGYATDGSEPPDLDFLNAWDMVESHKVPFPEFGVDLINEDFIEEDEQDDLEVGARLSSASNWEENWRFSKKKRFPYGLRHQILEYYADPPCMLIPNPADDTHAQIGDRDVDQLSELSERNSVGSLEFPDSDDEMQQENSAALVQLAQTVASEFSRKAPEPPAVPAILDLPVPKFKTPARRAQESLEIKFLSAPSNATVHTGKMATFDCEVTGTKPIGVAWFKQEQQLLEGERFQIYTICNRHVLHIYDTNPSDAGTLSCVAYGKKGEIWRDCELHVKATTRSKQAPDFVVPLRVVSIEGCTARLSCTVTGYPEPRLFIYCQKKLLMPSDKYFIESAGYGEWTLDIACVGKDDEGLYEAVVSNRHGKAVCCTQFTLDAAVPSANFKNANVVQEQNNKKETKKVTSSCIPNVVQRTWTERVAELERKAKNKMPKAIEQVNGGYYHYQDFSAVPESPVDLNAPPRPGTIAEREHRKWMNAAPIANNPYSPENVNRRRLERRVSDLSLSDGSITFEEYEKQQQLDPMLQTKNDLGAYQRDYYINVLTNGNRGGRRDPRHRDALNSLKEKVFVSADKVLTLETAVKQLEEEVQDVATEESVALLESRVAKAAEEVDSSSRQVCRVESEVDKLRQMLPNIHSKSNSRRSILQVPPFHLPTELGSFPANSSDSEIPSLPSVRNLATKFTSSESSPQTTPLLNRSAPKNHRVPDKNVIIVDKLSDGYSSSASQTHSPRSNFKVHSLTARSLSREFRQHAQKNLPRPMNRTRSISQEGQSPSQSQPQSLDQENGGATPGYTSDESSVSNASLPREKTKKRLSRSILQRASYWEKRAEQGLLSDNSVTEDFPIMMSNNDRR